MSSRSLRATVSPIASSGWTDSVPKGEQLEQSTLRVVQPHRGVIRFSLMISAARCVVTYVLIPLLSPFIQPAFGKSPFVVIPLSVLALFFDARAVRLISLSDRSWRSWAISFYGLLMAGITVLLIQDLLRLPR
jgi:hypothetical protein